MEWVEQWHHDVVPVAKLPLPQEMEHPPCMVGRRLRIPHRVARQVVPNTERRNCCDYHGQDWGRVSETAIRLLQAAHRNGFSGQEAADRALVLARAEGISATDLDSVGCLLNTDDPLMLDDEGEIYGGRHRIQAMIDQGVKRTILVRLELLDPSTGLPA